MKTILYLTCILTLITGCEKYNPEYIDNPVGPNALHNSPTGQSASDLLSSSTYTTLKIEIQYMPGYAPDEAAIAHLTNMLGTVLNKSEITVSTREILVSYGPVFSVNDLLAIERTNRTAFTHGTEMAVYVLYTNGSGTDPNALGVAYRNTSVAVFGKKIHDNSGELGQPGLTKLEATVLEHEMGHLLGLVNLGSPMLAPHEDGSHSKHCNNNSCLMYYAAETSDILGFLITGNIPSLDANCRADLRANGGK
jgi:hypothetical protein